LEFCVVILTVITYRLKRQSKDDFNGRQFEAWLIFQAVSRYLRYPLSYRDRITKLSAASVSFMCS
jgi:transposase-like protein